MGLVRIVPYGIRGYVISLKIKTLGVDAMYRTILSY